MLNKLKSLTERISAAKLPVRPTVIGFVILFAMNAWGLHVATSAQEDNKALSDRVDANQQVEIAENCHATNAGYAAARLATSASTSMTVEQVKGIRDRFIQSNYLNPPSTPLEIRNFRAGLRSFNNIVKESERLKSSAQKMVNRLTEPQVCPSP